MRGAQTEKKAEFLFFSFSLTLTNQLEISKYSFLFLPIFFKHKKEPAKKAMIFLGKTQHAMKDETVSPFSQPTAPLSKWDCGICRMGLVCSMPEKKAAQIY